MLNYFLNSQFYFAEYFHKTIERTAHIIAVKIQGIFTILLKSIKPPPVAVAAQKIAKIAITAIIMLIILRIVLFSILIFLFLNIFSERSRPFPTVERLIHNCKTAGADSICPFIYFYKKQRKNINTQAPKEERKLFLPRCLQYG